MWSLPRVADAYDNFEALERLLRENSVPNISSLINDEFKKHFLKQLMDLERAKGCRHAHFCSFKIHKLFQEIVGRVILFLLQLYLQEHMTVRRIELQVSN